IGLGGEVWTFGIGVLMLGVGLLPAITTSLVAVCVALAAVGFGVTWSVVAFITLRQRLTPPRLQGRTGADTAIAINLPQTLFTLLAAGIIGVVDYRALIIATAVAVLAAMVLMPRRRPADSLTEVNR